MSKGCVVFGALVVYVLLIIASVSFGKTATRKPYNKSEIKILYFTASWCLPCKKMEAEVLPKHSIITVISKYKSFTKYDTDTSTGRRMGLSYQINTVPCFLFLDKGAKEIKRINGFINEDKLLIILNARF